MSARTVFFRNHVGERLIGVLHWPRKLKSKSAVILVHGFVSDHRRKRFARLARAIARHGVPVLRFTFSGYDGSEGQFRDLSYQKQVRELRSAMDMLQKRGVRRFGIVGHSMGGGVALLTGQKDSRISAIVALAPVVHAFATHRRRWSKKEWQLLLRQGWLFYPDRTGRQWRVPKSFYTKLKNVHILEGMRTWHKPLLILGAEHDVRIPVPDLRALSRTGDPELTRLLIFKGTDHGFRAPHDERRMIRESVAWFQKYLFPDRIPGVMLLLRSGDRILLLKRSQALDTYSGYWHPVAGYLGDLSVRERALVELKEETGISCRAVRIERLGKAFFMNDTIPSGRQFTVHPVLASSKRLPGVRLDWEHSAYRWVRVRDLHRFRTIPGFVDFVQRLLP